MVPRGGRLRDDTASAAARELSTLRVAPGRRLGTSPTALADRDNDGADTVTVTPRICGAEPRRSTRPGAGYKIPDLSVPDASQAYIVRMVRHRDCDSLGALASNSYETYICDKQVGRHPQCYGWHQTVWAPFVLSKQSS